MLFTVLFQWSLRPRANDSPPLARSSLGEPLSVTCIGPTKLTIDYRDLPQVVTTKVLEDYDALFNALEQESDYQFPKIAVSLLHCHIQLMRRLRAVDSWHDSRAITFRAKLQASSTRAYSVVSQWRVGSGSKRRHRIPALRLHAHLWQLAFIWSFQVQFYTPRSPSGTINGTFLEFNASHNDLSAHILSDHHLTASDFLDIFQSGDGTQSDNMCSDRGWLLVFFIDLVRTRIIKPSDPVIKRVEELVILACPKMENGDTRGSVAERAPMGATEPGEVSGAPKVSDAFLLLGTLYLELVTAPCTRATIISWKADEAGECDGRLVHAVATYMILLASMSIALNMQSQALFVTRLVPIGFAPR